MKLQVLVAGCKASPRQLPGSPRDAGGPRGSPWTWGSPKPCTCISTASYAQHPGAALRTALQTALHHAEGGPYPESKASLGF